MGTQTLGGTGTVDFGTFDSRSGLWLPSSGTTLTVGTGITVHGRSGFVGYSPYWGGSTAVSVINQGTIEADVSGGDITIDGSGGAFTNTGVIDASSGTISVSPSSAGTVNSGTVAAGPTGTLSLSGPFSQTASGNLNEVLGGSDTGLYGQTSISGTASLDGSLNISEANGFSPNTGDVFTFLTYASETGQFANYNGLVLSDSAALQPAFNLTNATLTTVTDTTIAPDLRVTNLSISPANPQSSQSVTVNWNDIDAGNGSTGGSWTDHVVVTNTTTGQTIATADVPYDAATRGEIAPNGSAAVSYSFQLPVGPAGVGNLLVSVTTDYDETILEFYPGGVGYTDNTTTITAVSTLGAYPDLQVSGLTVVTATPQSGQPVTVDWNDANTGNGSVSGSFSDYVTVLNTTTGQTVASAVIPYDEGSSGPIAAGGSAAQQDTFNLPDGLPGIGQLVVTVTTDYYNQIFEYNASGTAETNNTSSVTTTSSLAPYADLQVTGLSTTPTSPQSGGLVTVTWMDENQGDGAVSGAFSDDVLVQQVNGSSLTYIASGTVSGPSQLAADATSAAQSFLFALPDGAAGTGDIRVTVTTDSGQTISEYDGNGNPAYGNNTASTDMTSTLASYADLVVAAGSLTVLPSSPQSGGSATVTWNDENQGDRAVNGAFTDSVLVQQESGGSLTYIASGTVSGNSSLAAGAASGTQSFPFTLPDGAAGTGDIRVTVTTDSGQTIKEYDSNGNLAYGNNSASIDVTSTLAKYADLIVAPNSLAVTPATPQSGGSATVTWMDENQGTGAASGSYLDYVLVVRINTGGGPTYVASGFVSGPSPLAAGATGTQESFAFTLPDGAAGVGNFSVTVTTDYYQSITEYDSNGYPAYGNNTSSITTTSTLGNYADLVVAPGSLTVTPSGPLSGGSVTATWMDENQGDAAVNGPFSDSVLVQQVSGSSLTTIASGTVSGDSSLAAGAMSGTQAFPFTLPNGAAGTGDIRVTVTTDNGETIKEYDGNGNPAYDNNIASTDVTATLAPSPDLVVQNIVVNGGSSNQVSPSQTIPVTWTDYNQGTVAANGTWMDQVFLASNAAGTQNLQLLQTVNVSDNLAASGALAQSATITVPATDVGNEYVVVETGQSESFFEFNTTNNTSVSSSSITIPPSVQVSLAAPGNSTFNKNTVNPATQRHGHSQRHRGG